MSYRVNSLTITCVQKIYNYDIFIVFQLCIPIKYMYIFILILYYKDIKLIFLFINRFFILNITTSIAFKVSYDTVFLTWSSWRRLYTKIWVISVCVCVRACMRTHVIESTTHMLTTQQTIYYYISGTHTTTILHKKFLLTYKLHRLVKWKPYKFF